MRIKPMLKCQEKFKKVAVYFGLFVVLAVISLGFQNCSDKVAFESASSGDVAGVGGPDPDPANPTDPVVPTDPPPENVVCDPFRLVEGRCQRGLVAQLYYASASDRALGNTALYQKYDSVLDLIQLGIRSPAIIYLPYLDVRTRHFAEGFGTQGGTSLLDDSGQLLDEWFALDMETVLKLGPNEQEGFYQMMLISDDGSVLSVDPDRDGQFRTIINNDGTHPTRVGCTTANDAVYMTAQSRIPARMQYYQGPRTEIAMSFFWRRVTAPDVSHSAYCGLNGGSGWLNTHQNYNLILQEGFRPLGEDNFILNEVR